jgi:hypothetical protein
MLNGICEEGVVRNSIKTQPRGVSRVFSKEEQGLKRIFEEKNDARRRLHHGQNNVLTEYLIVFGTRIVINRWYR